MITVILQYGIKGSRFHTLYRDYTADTWLKNSCIHAVDAMFTKKKTPIAYYLSKSKILFQCINKELFICIYLPKTYMSTKNILFYPIILQYHQNQKVNFINTGIFTLILILSL